MYLISQSFGLSSSIETGLTKEPEVMANGHGSIFCSFAGVLLSWILFLGTEETLNTGYADFDGTWVGSYISPFADPVYSLWVARSPS